jgi:hypothetical protein
LFVKLISIELYCCTTMPALSDLPQPNIQSDQPTARVEDTDSFESAMESESATPRRAAKRQRSQTSGAEDERGY